MITVRTGLSLFAASALSTLVLGVGGAQAAEPQRITPLMPVISPRPASEIQNRFHRALGRGLESSGVELSTRVKRNPCASRNCARELQNQVRADAACAATIRTTGKNYEFEVTLYRDGVLMARSNGRCDICTLREAIDGLANTTKQATVAYLAQPHMKAKRTTDKTQTHSETSLNTGVGKRATDVSTDADLRETDDRSDAADSWPIWPAVATGGVAVAALAVGLPLIAMDGDGTNCRGDPGPNNRNCELLLDTATGGWVLTGIGVASLIASGVLFYLYFRPADDPRTTQGAHPVLSAIPVPGGVMFGTVGSF